MVILINNIYKIKMTQYKKEKHWNSLNFVKTTMFLENIACQKIQLHAISENIMCLKKIACCETIASHFKTNRMSYERIVGVRKNIRRKKTIRSWKFFKNDIYQITITRYLKQKIIAYHVRKYNVLKRYLVLKNNSMPFKKKHAIWKNI